MVHKNTQGAFYPEKDIVSEDKKTKLYRLSALASETTDNKSILFKQLNQIIIQAWYSVGLVISSLYYSAMRLRVQSLIITFFCVISNEDICLLNFYVLYVSVK